MHTHRVLMVVTSAEMMGTAPEPTGVWLEEVAAPYYAFLDARCEITLASPQGGAAPVDARSLAESSQTAATRRFAVDTKAQHALAHTLKLASLQPDQYDAVFFAGGHGTMQDFVQDASVARTLEQFVTASKPTALVCHGPAALVNAKTPRGTPLVQGRRITCFSDEEERLVELDAHVPFLLESRLREQGATLSLASGPFQPHVVVDEQLITGQNPASSIPVAEAVIHQLRMRESAVAA